MIFTAAQLSALPVLDTCDVLIAGGGVAGVLRIVCRSAVLHSHLLDNLTT